uniref:DNA N-6-adenine-methyltransferase n=1 Tax=Siphoviridae sp. ctBCr48 TaxID=2827802 RepID=A0A8S5SHF3_9CAUD|nr:MAG TPA: DNA N-6-adenine-methyltransferase [Siphoviridae sp. ctBCr48]
MNTEVLYSSKEEKWATPQDFFDKLNDEFHFTLDAAASPDNAKCPVYFTEEQDGLAQNWEGHTVWCNPPYCRKTGAWVKKAYEEHQRTGCTVVMLLPSRTDVRWFHDYILGKAEIRFIKGRLKFGGSKNSAPFPSIVVIYR